MIDTLKYFFKSENLFDLQPAAGFNHERLILLAALLIFILSLVEWILVKRVSQNKAYRILSEKFLYFLIFLSLGLTIIDFFRREEVYLFSSNIFILIILLTFFIWFLLIVYYIIFKVGKVARNFKRSSEINKYLPRASQKW